MSKAGLLIPAPQTLFCLVFPSQLTGILLDAPAKPPGGPSFSYICICSPAILGLCLRTAPASDYPSFPPTPGHHHSAPQLYAVVPVGVPPGPRTLPPQPSSPQTPGRPPLATCSPPSPLLLFTHPSRLLPQGHYVLKGGGISHPRLCHVGMRVSVSQRRLEGSGCREGTLTSLPFSP